MQKQNTYVVDGSHEVQADVEKEAANSNSDNNLDDGDGQNGHVVL